MGDRSTLEVVVYDCPREQAAVVAGSLANLMMDLVPAGPGLVLGESHVDGQTTIDVPTGLAVHLAEHAPGATFTVIGGSYSPYPAEVHHHAPGLGLYSSDASENGEPTFAATDVQQWITEWVQGGGGDPEVLRALVQARSGHAHQARIAALRAGLASGARPRVLRPVWPCSGCGSPVRERDPGSPWRAWVHADTGALMRTCADGTGLADPDRAAVAVFCG